jgi:hypothetical protein
MSELVALAVVLFLVGGLLWTKAWRDAGGSTSQANTSKINRAQLLGGLATGVWTGAAIAVGLLLLLQQWLAASSADAVWRANVATAADIPGFTPAGHKLHGLDLSGKQLQDANLRGANLTGVQLRDTDLTNADLTGANLHDVVMYKAILTEANLKGADLSGAQLQDIHFENTQVWGVKTFDNAVANAYTCWPTGFLKRAIAKGLRAGPATGQNGTSFGREYPNCLPPR